MENKLRKFIYLVGSVLELIFQFIAVFYFVNNKYEAAIFWMTWVILLDIQTEGLKEKN